MKIRSSYLLSAVLLGLMACLGATLPHVSPMQVSWAAQRWPGMDETQFEQIRILYTNRCSGCHNVVLPKKHSLAEWPRYLDKMAPKAKINNEQKELIWRYIQTIHEAPTE